jgi:GTPase SAR1 family protein
MAEKQYDFSLMIIGLESAGKSTILQAYKKPLEPIIVTPTNGFAIDLIKIPPC